ncbi:MAG: hypothetical protein GY881_06165 [Gammaproteobacteria bacterium]|nr:hypothetical protein [Gammaproteobacteria bacterium]
MITAVLASTTNGQWAYEGSVHSSTSACPSASAGWASRVWIEYPVVVVVEHQLNGEATSKVSRSSIATTEATTIESDVDSIPSSRP